MVSWSSDDLEKFKQKKIISSLKVIPLTKKNTSMATTTIIKKQQQVNISKYRRGRELEIKIEKTLDNLNKLDNCIAIRLEVKTIHNGKSNIYVKKQPADILIITKDTVWLLDMKECHSSTWYPKKAPTHQIQNMLKMQSMGYRAGFLVWFKEAQDVLSNLRLIETFDKPITVSDGLQFGVDIFFYNIKI